MKLRDGKVTLGLSLLLVTGIALTGCTSVAPTATETSAVKEAGTLGTRLCFTNGTDKPISAAPSPQVEAKNASHNVGAAGSITDSSELCFAGWNSYRLDGWGSSTNTYHSQLYDVATTVNVDGVYDALSFRGVNEWIGLPLVYWTTGEQGSEQPYDGRSMNVGDVENRDFEGNSFTITRREDSEFYKEFLIRFTK